MILTRQRFWDVENCGIERCDTKIFTKEESETLRKLENSISYIGERYKVGVPWKDNRPELPDNRHTALTRLCNTENKLKKDPVVGAEYAQTIQAYVEKGYLRKVQPDEELPPEAWYLPHFPVVCMDKTTTKVRIVFDVLQKRMYCR